MLSINLSDSELNNLLEAVTDGSNIDLMQIESSYRKKIESIVKEAVNEHIDRLFVEPNKHLTEHHKDALSDICTDYQHLCNSL